MKDDPLKLRSGLRDELIRRIRAHSIPRPPLPTDARPNRQPLKNVRAVLFDVYGTLFVSGSGDIGLTSKADPAEVLPEALRAAGCAFSTPDATIGPRAAEMFFDEIRCEHARLRDRGVDHPEVEIREIWRRVLARLDMETDDPDLPTRLAVEYECRANPAWPMPGLLELLTAVRRAGLAMGIVSNAQFFTPLLFPALLEGRTTDSLGFRPNLCFYSFARRVGKPSTQLFEEAFARLLETDGVRPEETVYLGNDVRNDVVPPASLGGRTILFAGDARSLRRRENDPSVGEVRPDREVADLVSVGRILGLEM